MTKSKDKMIYVDAHEGGIIRWFKDIIFDIKNRGKPLKIISYDDRES